MPGSDSRDIAAMLPYCILRYVAQAVGESAAEAIRVEAGETRSLEELEERGAWSSEETTLAIAEAASRLTGDAHIGRRGGEELLRLGAAKGITDFYLAEGSIPAALDLVIALSSRVSTMRSTAVIERGDRHILVEGRCRHGARPPRLLCDFALGYWSGVPSVFGADGYAVELECEARGATRCLFKVSWVPGDVDVDIEAAADRGDRMFVRFEELQATAAELAAAKDVGVVLDLVVERAGHAVLAPRFLVAVRVDDRAELAVRHRGFGDEASARAAADAVLSGPAPPSTLVVDVASTSRLYGKIAAFFPPGTDGDESDRRLLSAYAGHAVAALEAAASFEQARRDRDTAQALLDLATMLAQVASTDEVAARVACAVPAVAGSDAASVWLWDPDTRSFRRSASSQEAMASMLPEVLPSTELGDVAVMLDAPRPVFLEAATANGAIGRTMRALGAHHSALVPIVARNELLGVVTAGFRRELGDEEQALLLERLSAMADQAATAFDNARLVEHVRRQSLHDALTGLPNRSLVEERANLALAAARRSCRRVGLLFVDLDRFKNVNDTLGHRAGDELIRQVAARLTNEVREIDTLARLGGDEFVVLLPDVPGEADAVNAAGRLVDALGEPFMIEGQELYISCSIGVAVTGTGVGDYDSLLRHADAAMYDAKAQGRNTVAAHTWDRAGVNRRHRLALESDLHHALDNGELTVVYQPQVELVSGSVIGVEALTRWQHPTLGLVGPDVFIPIAEESGLILALDRWVRRTALAQAKAWRLAGLADLRLALNVSPSELRDPAFAARLAADIADSGVPPDAVEVEISERMVLADGDDLARLLDPLAATGVRLALDDFGTGSSALGRLQRSSFDTLKIDRSFISEIGSASADTVVAALIGLAADLGLDVVAEGVETEAQRATLVDLGCPLVQGYLLGRPKAPGGRGELVYDEGSEDRTATG